MMRIETNITWLGATFLKNRGSIVTFQISTCRRKQLSKQCSNRDVIKWSQFTKLYQKTYTLKLIITLLLTIPEIAIGDNMAHSYIEFGNNWDQFFRSETKCVKLLLTLIQ